MIQKRFEQILSIAEAEGGNLQRADEVELQVIESVRQLENDVLTSRANQRIDKDNRSAHVLEALLPYLEYSELFNAKAPVRKA